MPATPPPGPEDFDPFCEFTCLYGTTTFEQPPWMQDPDQCCDFVTGYTRKIGWGLTLGTNYEVDSEDSMAFPDIDFRRKCDGGYIVLAGGGYVLVDDARRKPPHYDGQLRAQWKSSSLVTVAVGLNQNRLLATSWGLHKEEAEALYYAAWKPVQETPGKIERNYLAKKKEASEHLAGLYGDAVSGKISLRAMSKRQAECQKRIALLRDDQFVLHSRDMKTLSLENQFMFALGRAFATNLRKRELRPPTRKEVSGCLGSIFKEHSSTKNEGSWSYLFNHMGFGWL